MRRATHCRLRSFLSGAFLPLLLLLCSAPRIARASTNATPPCWGSATTTSDDTVAPAVHAALAAIADLATRARAASNVPGVSIAVLHADRVIYAGGFGCANIAADHVATAHSIDRAGSITKLFTDTMLMQLRDAGLLELDRPVRDYVPEVWFRTADGAAISPTFRQLASHTAGLPRSLQPPPVDPSALFTRLHDVPAIDAPGARVSYSNLGVAVLGQALAAIAGERYHDYITDHILAPLGMISSGFDPAVLPAAQRTAGYTRVQVSPDGAVAAPPVSVAVPGPIAPAGGLYTTALDLMRFAALQIDTAPAGAGVLAGASVREMRQPVASAEGPASVGIGWFIRELEGETMLMHNGSVDGYRADLRVVPSLGLAVAVLYNQRPPADSPFRAPEGLSMAVLTSLVRALHGEGASQERTTGIPAP